MSIKLKHTFWVNEDKDTDLQEIFDSIIDKVKKNLLPGDYAFYFCDRKKSRSMGQLKYYMGVVLKMISKETGYTIDELHEFFKEKYLPIKIVTINEESIETISTKNVTSKEMGEYIEQIRAWARLELDLHIPTKDELSIPPPKSNYQDIVVDAENDHWVPKKDRKKTK